SGATGQVLSPAAGCKTTAVQRRDVVAHHRVILDLAFRFCLFLFVLEPQQILLRPGFSTTPPALNAEAILRNQTLQRIRGRRLGPRTEDHLIVPTFWVRPQHGSKPIDSLVGIPLRL